MIPASFEYTRATSVEEALGKVSGDNKILAGGHSLIPAMKLRLNQPDQLIDISRLDALRGIREDGDNLVIGAATTHGEIATSGLVQTHSALCAQGAGMIGDVQVRNKGTLGGSIAHADPAADWPAILIAAGAQIKCQSSDGTRVVAASDFFTGFFETVLAENEIITEVHLPKLGAGHSSCYRKFVQPASRFAIVGCAVVVAKEGGKVTSVRVALSGVGEKAYAAAAAAAALQGKPLDDAAIASAAEQATQGIDVLADHYASEEYRTHLAKLYVARALGDCK